MWIPRPFGEATRAPMWKKMTEEVAGEIAELKRDFDNLDDEIAVRASATRLRRYATLRSKVELYETALSSSAATLKNELMKNPRLYRSARPESSRGHPKGSIWRRSDDLRASGTVGLRWQAVFGSSDRLE